MDVPSKFLEQIAFNTRAKIEEHKLLVMDKSTHEEHLHQPLQTKNKQFMQAITFLTGYNGIFNATVKKNKFFFAISITDEDNFIQKILSKGVYETEN